MHFQTSYNGRLSYTCLPFEWPWQTSSKGLAWFGYLLSEKGTDDPDSVDWSLKTDFPSATLG